MPPDAFTYLETPEISPGSHWSRDPLYWPPDGPTKATKNQATYSLRGLQSGLPDWYEPGEASRGSR